MPWPGSFVTCVERFAEFQLNVPKRLACVNSAVPLEDARACRAAILDTRVAPLPPPPPPPLTFPTLGPSGTADVCAETDFAIPIAATPPSSAISERFRLSVLSGLNQEFMTASSIAVIIGNIDRRRARLRHELDRAEWAGVGAAPTGSQRYANRDCRRDPVVTI